MKAILRVFKASGAKFWVERTIDSENLSWVGMVQAYDEGTSPEVVDHQATDNLVNPFRAGAFAAAIHAATRRAEQRTRKEIRKHISR